MLTSAGAPRGASWWSFSTAGRVIFGSGSSQCLSDAAGSLGSRVLVCTDQNLVAAGVLAPLVASLRAAADLEVAVFDEGEAEIGIAGAERCAAQVRGFAPDVVVGLGGGSNLDLAKVVATRLCSDEPIASWSAGVPRAALPVVAVPTTAGTGSEVTPIAVLTDEENQTKVGLSSRAFLPRAVLVDPLLTLSCPSRVTAHSGMDALTHALEAYLAIDFADKAPQPYAGQAFVGKNPLSDTLALQAISLIGCHLRAAVVDGADVWAREAMALGSLLAGMAFASAGTAIVHALQYPIGALTKTPHGLGNAVLLPAAVRFNLETRLAEAAVVARLLGSCAPSERDAAGELADLLGHLALSVGITPNLRSLGVAEPDLGPIAEAASRITRLTANNARRVDERGLYEVLSDALDFTPGDVAIDA